MLIKLQTRLKRAGRLLPLALLPFAAHAQLGYPAASAVNVASTYTDLAATGTAIATANTDDANSAAQSIGFTFAYNGTSFTQFVLNTNGFIKLGATAPSAVDLFLPESMTATQIDPFESTNAADVNIVAPFNFDLTAGTAVGGTEYRVANTGTAPNRVCIIQWKNVADKTLSYDQQYGSINFQVKLYETSGNIEFVYGTTVQGTFPDDYRFAVTGIKGSSTAQSVMVVKSGPGTTPWSAANFINGFYTTAAFQYSGNVRPDLGRTYRFVPGAAAPGPTNDDPAGAITLTLALTCTPTNATNLGATTTPVNGYVNGTNPNSACGIAVTPKDVWFQFTTPASGPGSTAVVLNVTGAPAGYLRLFSTTGGATGPFTEIACASGRANNVASAPLSASGLMPNTTYYVFVSGFGSGDTTGPFTICAVAPQNNDLAAQSVYTLGTVSSYASPVTVSAAIKNVGSVASTARNATLTVSGATTYTTTQAIPVIAAGATVVVTFTAYPVAATTGINTVTVTLPADDAVANNTATAQQALSAATLSYTDPSIATFTGGFGSNSTTVTTATFYSKYTISAASSTVSAITPTFVGMATASNNYQVLVVAASAAGTPGTVLYTSPTRVRPLAGGADVVAVPNVPVSGSFYVAVRQLTTTNLGLAYQTESPLRLATFYASNDGLAFTDLSAVGIAFRPALAATMSTVTATQNAALAATVSLYPNPAHQGFQLTVPTGLRAASATLSNALGQVVQSRQLNLPAAGGTTDFNVRSLAPGIYTLVLKSGADLVVKRVVVE